ncbi:MAG: hypothetical protein ACYTGH_13160, partial [Planctomycetota bacterium]
MPSLEDSVQYIKGVGPARAGDFTKIGVITVRQLLFTFPRRLSDRSLMVTVAEALRMSGQEVSLRLSHLKCKTHRSRNGKKVVTSTFADDTGRMTATWFGMPWIAESLEDFDGEALLFGKVDYRNGSLNMVHPILEKVEEEGGEGRHRI